MVFGFWHEDGRVRNVGFRFSLTGGFVFPSEVWNFEGCAYLFVAARDAPLSVFDDGRFSSCGGAGVFRRSVFILFFFSPVNGFSFSLVRL
eukprot:UN4064